jgi:hypothetical protein
MDASFLFRQVVSCKTHGVVYCIFFFTTSLQKNIYSDKLSLYSAIRMLHDHFSFRRAEVIGG